MKVCMLALLAVPFVCLATAQSTTRLLRGEVQTHTNAEEKGRSLSESGSQDHQVFLVGYANSSKYQVSSELTALGATILTPLPESHWLVKAKPSDILAVQEAYPTTTVATPPKEFKVSEDLEDLIEKLEDGQKEGNYTFKHLVTQKTPDGHLQLKLSVHGLPFTTIKATIGPNATSEGKAARAAAVAWENQVIQNLTSALSLDPGSACTPNGTASMFGTLTLVVCIQHLKTATSWLAEQVNVIYVNVARAASTHNLQTASAIQTTALTEPLPTDPSNNSQHFPFWNAGLDGSGQVVGVADTGLDMDSCFFYDPKYTPGYQDNPSTIQSRTYPGIKYKYYNGDKNRKVQTYFFGVGDFGNKVDNSGHGTHVSGTVAGSAYNIANPEQDPNLGTGVAPGARLAMFDMQSEAFIKEEGIDAIQTPEDIASIYDVQYQRGVRISSNSWGASMAFTYDSMCDQIDRFVWIYDMLIVFAAGNDGFDPDYSTGTVTSPAICKNTLAVGATDNWRATKLTQRALEYNNGTQKDIGASVFTAQSGLLFYAVFPGYKQILFLDAGLVGNSSGENLVLWNSSEPLESRLETAHAYEVVLAKPQDACSQLQNTDLSGKFVLFVNGNCSPDTKASNVVGTGAVAGILYVTSGTIVPVGSPQKIPFVSLPQAGDLQQRLEAGEPITTTVKSRDPQQEVIAFSSYGPTGKNARIKPEITSTGVTLSAYTNGTYTGIVDHCNVGTMQGTSMAAPGVSAAAAIVRQYFMDGFYPTGEKVAADSFEPPASLVRAVLLAGAEAMTGIAGRTGNALGNTTNNNEGFGRVNLARSLPVKGVNDGLAMHVYHSDPFTKEGTTYQFKANASSGPLVIMLSWMDLPGVPGTGDIIIQDLDLKVVSGSQVWWGNGVTGGDRNNNNERVIIEDPSADEYTIEVTARSLFTEDGPQRFSLVALGGVVAGPPAPNFPPSKAPDTNLSSFVFPVNQTTTIVYISQKQLDNARLVEVHFPFADKQKAEQAFQHLDSFANQAASDIENFMPPGSLVVIDGSTLSTASTRRALKQAATIIVNFTLVSPDGSTSEEARSIAESVVQKFNNGTAYDFPFLNAYGVSASSMTAIDITDGYTGSSAQAGLHIAAIALALAAYCLV